MRNKISRSPVGYPGRLKFAKDRCLGDRPSFCRPTFVQNNRTLRSDLASLSASLYRASSVSGFVIVWLAKIGPEACGVRLAPVESI
jgi:hypothetical protein